MLSTTTSGCKYLDRKLGGRDWASLYRGAKPIVFGHRVVGDTARHRNERAWAIDTGACHGGALTALVTPGFELVQVTASSDHWARERRVWERPVLEARPWETFRFKKLERELGTLEAGRSKTGQAFAKELRAWLGELDHAIPALLDRARARCLALAAEHTDKALKKALAREPASGLLFSAHAGSLDVAAAKSQLNTPAALADAMRAFGMSTPGRTT